MINSLTALSDKKVGQKGPRLLIVLHDLYDLLDRRVVNNAKVLVEMGYSVNILCLDPGKEWRHSSDLKGINIYGAPVGNFPFRMDPLWANGWIDTNMAMFGFPLDEAPLESSSRSIDRSLGKRLSAVRKSIISARFKARRLVLQTMKIITPKMYQRLQGIYRKWLQSKRYLSQHVYRWVIGLHASQQSKKFLGDLVNRLLELFMMQGDVYRDLTQREQLQIKRVALGEEFRFSLPRGERYSGYPMHAMEALYYYSQNLKPDLIMACDLPALPACKLLKDKLDVPLVYDAHELYPYQKELTARQKLLLAYYEAKCLPSVDLFFTVADTMVPIFADKYGNKFKPKVITNAPNFDEQRKHLKSNILRETLNIPEHDAVLLYHGGFVKQSRNLERIMTSFAANNFPDAWLVFLGFGEHEYFENLARGLSSRIVVHSSVSQEELPHWVSGADAVIISYQALDDNTKGCFPNKLGDCIELGVPIISNDQLLFVRQLVENFDFGVIGDVDTDEGMVKLMAKGLQWLREGGRHKFSPEAIRQIYGWATQKEKLKEYFGVFETYHKSSSITNTAVKV